MKRDSRAFTKTLSHFIAYAPIVVGAIAVLFPLAWMFSTSIKQDAEVYNWPPRLLPALPDFSAYTRIWRLLPFAHFFGNSLLVSLTVVVVTSVINSLAGFAFAKYRFRGRELLFLLLLGTMMIPLQATAIPTFWLVKQLNWVNRFSGLIVPSLADAFGVFLIRQFVLEIPEDLLDAARIDGCSELGIFSRIVMPLCKPALATLAIFGFERTWNDFFWPLIVTNSVEMKTVQLGLTYFTGQYFTLWNLLMAAVVVVTLPVIILFVFLQRYFIQGITMSGLKS